MLAQDRLELNQQREKINTSQQQFYWRAQHLAKKKYRKRPTISGSLDQRSKIWDCFWAHMNVRWHDGMDNLN